MTSSNPFDRLGRLTQQAGLTGHTQRHDPSLATEVHPSLPRAMEAAAGMIVRITEGLPPGSLDGPVTLTPRQCDYFRTWMLEKLGALADGSLRGAEAGLFKTEVEVLDSSHRTDGRYWHVDNAELKPLIWMTYALSNAVALLEGNLPPNDRGLRANDVMSLPRLDEQVINLVREARVVAARYGTEFGESFSSVFNAIIARLEHHRPLFDGTPIHAIRLPKL